MQSGGGVSGGSGSGVLLESTQHIAAHAVRAFPKPQSDEAVTLAFGSFSIPKLVAAVTDEMLVRRQKGLKALMEELSKPEHVVEAVQAGIVAALHAAAHDSDVTVNERAAAVFGMLTVRPDGREAVISGNGLADLRVLCTHANPRVRVAAYQALVNATSVRAGVLGCLAGGVLELVVGRLLSERGDTIQPVMLTVLYNIAMEEAGLQAALADSRATRACIDLTKTSVAPAVQQKAALALGVLCAASAGKLTSVSAEAVAALSSLLTSSDALVQTRAAGALMSVCVDVRAKAQAFDAAVHERVLPLVKPSASAPLLVNALRTLAAVAEEPRARQALQQREAEVLAALDAVKASAPKTHVRDAAELVRYVDTCKRVITWRA